MKLNETIVITRMYNGEFLNDANGLAGEIINLFKTDQGENYVYINSDGTIGKEYDDTVSTIYMVHLKNEHLLEVVGVAKIPPDGQIVYKTTGDSGQQIAKYLESHLITYAGVPIDRIHGQTKGILTFRADEILIPKNPIYITDNKEFENEKDGIFFLPDINFGRQTQKNYATNIKHKKSFDKLKLLLNSDLWDKDRSGNLDISKTRENFFNFLSIIRKEDDEPIFSNLFYYFLDSDRELFVDFCHSILGLTLQSESIIKREYAVEPATEGKKIKKFIDLYFNDKDNIVVIENKIKSGINGECDRHNFSDGGKVQSQLGVYYDLIQKEAKEQGKKPHFFIFLPDYSKIDISKYLNSRYYTLIRYSKLYDFFKQYNMVKIPDWQIEAGYYRDFVRALHRHAKTRENDWYSDIEDRFIRRIKKQKRLTPGRF